jgi:hypothetical protein
MFCFRSKESCQCSPSVYHCRGNHVWWSLTTVRVLPDHRRTESNVSLLPGKRTQESPYPFFLSLLHGLVSEEKTGASLKIFFSCSVLMGVRPLYPSWTSGPSTMSSRGSGWWVGVRRRSPGTACRTMDPALSVPSLGSNNWGCGRAACRIGCSSRKMMYIAVENSVICRSDTVE